MPRSQVFIFMLALVSYSTWTSSPARSPAPGGRGPASEALLGGDIDDTPTTTRHVKKPKVVQTQKEDSSAADEEAAPEIPACGSGWQTNAKLVGAKFAKFLGARSSGLKKAVVDEKEEGSGIQPEVTLIPSSAGTLFVRLRAGSFIDLTESAKACMLGGAMKVEVDNSRASGMAAFAGSKIVMLFSSGRSSGLIRLRASIHGHNIDSNFSAEAAN